MCIRTEHNDLSAESLEPICIYIPDLQTTYALRTAFTDLRLYNKLYPHHRAACYEEHKILNNKISAPSESIREGSHTYMKYFVFPTLDDLTIYDITRKLMKFFIHRSVPHQTP